MYFIMFVYATERGNHLNSRAELVMSIRLPGPRGLQEPGQYDFACTLHPRSS